MPSHPLSILLLEDNAVIAQRFKKIFESWSKAGRILLSETLREALEVIAHHKIDLLVSDLNLPDGSGVEAIRSLGQQQPHAQAIVISSLSHRKLVIDAIQAGAVGYLLKDDDSIEVLQACEGVLAGASPMSPSIARLMIEAVQNKLVPKTASNEASENLLTSRERDVLTAIARGYTYREVAELYGISSNTVPVHIRNIYRKLQVTNRSQAAFEARQMGLIQA